MKVAILSGTVYGAAEEVSNHARDQLAEAGFDAWHDPRATLEGLLAFAPQALLVVTSTTGMGELPDTIMPLYSSLRDQLPGALRGLPGGVIALGDSNYDLFCGAGDQVVELFAELGVNELQPMLRLDASETVTPELDAKPWIASFASQLRAMTR